MQRSLISLKSLTAPNKNKTDIQQASLPIKKSKRESRTQLLQITGR